VPEAAWHEPDDNDEILVGLTQNIFIDYINTRR
jgi:hypothetical protein